MTAALLLRCRARFAFAFVSLIAALCLLPTRTSAAIAFDAAAGTSATNAAAVSWSHTVGTGTNNVLIVGLAMEDTSTASLAVNSITYNGVAMTLVPSSTATDGTSTFNRTVLYYLINPAAGAHTVSITFGGAVNGVDAGSISLNGAAQSAPTAAGTAIADASASLSATASVTTA